MSFSFVGVGFANFQNFVNSLSEHELIVIVLFTHVAPTNRFRNLLSYLSLYCHPHILIQQPILSVNFQCVLDSYMCAFILLSMLIVFRTKLSVVLIYEYVGSGRSVELRFKAWLVWGGEDIRREKCIRPGGMRVAIELYLCPCLY